MNCWCNCSLWRRKFILTASWRERQGKIRHRVGFYPVIITPVKGKHFPPCCLVSKTLSLPINVFMGRQKRLLPFNKDVLLEKSWIFRLPLNEALINFFFCFALFCFEYFYCKYLSIFYINLYDGLKLWGMYNDYIPLCNVWSSNFFFYSFIGRFLIC